VLGIFFALKNPTALAGYNQQDVTFLNLFIEITLTGVLLLPV
jgi:hypothetical protein